MILKPIFISLTIHFLQKSEASLGKAIGDVLTVLSLEILEKECKNVACCPNRTFHKLPSCGLKPRSWCSLREQNPLQAFLSVHQYSVIIWSAFWFLHSLVAWDILSVSLKASKAEFQKPWNKAASVSRPGSENWHNTTSTICILVKQLQSQPQFKKRKHRPSLSVNGIPGGMPKNV